jgi:hypothetical protein
MKAYVYRVSLLQQLGLSVLLLVLGACAGLSVNPHQWWVSTLACLAASASCFVLAVLAFINGLRMVLGWFKAVFGWR